MFGGMTMRDAQAEWFMRVLGKHYPDLVEPMNGLYRGEYVPVDENYHLKTNGKVLSLLWKYDIPFRVKRWLPEDFRKYNFGDAHQQSEGGHQGDREEG